MEDWRGDPKTLPGEAFEAELKQAPATFDDLVLSPSDLLDSPSSRRGGS